MPRGVLSNLYETSVWEPQASKFIKKENLAQIFSCELCEISKNIFFYRTLQWMFLFVARTFLRKNLLGSFDLKTLIPPEWDVSYRCDIKIILIVYKIVVIWSAHFISLIYKCEARNNCLQHSIFGLTLKRNTQFMVWSLKQATKLGYPSILLKSYFLKAELPEWKEKYYLE